MHWLMRDRVVHGRAVMACPLPAAKSVWRLTALWVLVVPMLFAATAARSQTAATGRVDINPPASFDLAGLVGVPLVRQSFHSFCPFPVPQPSLTWVAQATEWAQLLKGATVQPPPYAEKDVDFASQRLVVIAAAARPGPTSSMQVLKAPLAVAYNPGTRRLSVRVQEQDTPTAPGMMTAAVLGQPCLVLWLRFNQPVSEVIARNTRDQTLGRQTLR
jgi:hypothetical protein